jgi:hypothetical protein
MAPKEGLEPSTHRLTADCSTIELLWNPRARESNVGDSARQLGFGRADQAGRISEKMAVCVKVRAGAAGEAPAAAREARALVSSSGILF